MEDLTADQIGYKLRSACSDCPFRKSSPLHEGVMRALPEYHRNLKEGRFGHTCHKTDPRSDGYTDEYKGQIQHCVGSLSMLKKMELADGEEEGEFPTQPALIYALVGGFKYEDIPVDPDVFESFNDMAAAYKPMIEELANRPRVHISYVDGRREWTHL